MKILIVEDDPATAELLSAALAANRYTVDLATDGAAGLALVNSWEYDLILLDVQLPKLNGIQVCQTLRSSGNKTPILMLTVQESDRDVITGLDAGADDYVIKPCNLEHLLARIRSLLRRRMNAASPILEWGDLRLELITGRVTFGMQELSLRRKEYLLLELFLSYPQRIFSRSAILDHLWTADNFPSEGAVTNLIKDLRRQLSAAGMPEDLIETLYGLGYRLKPAPQPSVPIASDIAASDIAASNHETQTVADSIEQITRQFQAAVKLRLQELAATAQQMLSGQAKPADCGRLKQEVHRLAGSLGLYGYQAAADIARSIDRLLAGIIGAFAPNAAQNAVPVSFSALQAAQLMQRFAQLQQALNQSPLPHERSQSDAPLVLVFSEDDDWAEALQQASRQWNLQVEVIPDWTVFQQFLLRFPAAIVLETKADPIDLTLLHSIKQQFPGLPILTVTAQNDLASRVAASQAGIACYLVKPVAPAQLFAALTSLLPSKPGADWAKMLIVDDDPEIHPRLSCLLQIWGLKTISLEDPQQFWQVLTQTHPDAVLLDVAMPAFNGIELCRVLRQDIQYRSLPVFVMTGHAEAGCQQQVLAAGANDLLHKSIGDAELVMRVVERMQQFLQGRSATQNSCR